uniref:Uncharacterized protein n=1 Tax=Ascaris lumbricoides TaxID=6252 RepID=A0A0M3IN15_ASCLU
MRRPPSGAGNVSSTDDIRSPRCSDSGMGASWYSFSSTHPSEDIHEMNGNCNQMEKQHDDEYNLWSGTDIEFNFLPDILPRDILNEKCLAKGFEEIALSMDSWMRNIACAGFIK